MPTRAQQTGLVVALTGLILWTAGQFACTGSW